ncbi:acyltransferase [Paramagnetospirillum caucaseum]|uniref:Acyltransferase n=1 Tax=Paramagnetospirillum caucaseum TaxID=1244869 RepID=M3ADE6_9PROT|nr:acyltransferase [Paramagnetospirillum caucaseum]EME70524.1 acyltransferase [Paramagnetospirillum caucaseum]
MHLLEQIPTNPDHGLRITSIDGLRGIAACMVMLAHLMPVPADPLGAQIVSGLDWLFQHGQTGVLLFFLISGYVVPSSLLGHPDSHLRRFAVSRVMRLYPAYWASIILALFILPSPPGWTAIAVNVTLGQRFLGVEDLLGVYWTLQVEMVFYVLCTLLFLCRILQTPERLGWLVASLGIALLAAAFIRRQFGVGLPVGWGLYMLLMLFGAWCRLAAPAPARQWRAAGALILLLLGICWALYYPQAFARHWLSHFAGFAIALLLFLALNRSTHLSWRPLVLLGEISYSVYLLHSLMRPASLELWPALAADPYLAFLVQVGLSLVLSALIYRVIEKPGVRLGRRWADAWVAHAARRRALITV